MSSSYFKLMSSFQKLKDMHESAWSKLSAEAAKEKVAMQFVDDAMHRAKEMVCCRCDGTGLVTFTLPYLNHDEVMRDCVPCAGTGIQKLKG